MAHVLILGRQQTSKQEEVITSGSNYTWFNKQEGSGIYHEIGISDHTPLVVSNAEDRRRGSPFRFCEMWISHPDFHEVINSVPLPQDGYPSYRLCS